MGRYQPWNVLRRDLYPVKLKKEMAKLETILIQNFEEQNKNIRNANSSVATLEEELSTKCEDPNADIKPVEFWYK